MHRVTQPTSRASTSLLTAGVLFVSCMAVRRTAAAAAAAVTATTAALRSESLREQRAELAAALNDHASFDDAAAAAACVKAHRLCVLRTALRDDRNIARAGFDPMEAARTAGAAAAMMLPTVHQADSYRYARLGAVLGERAAAFAASQLAADFSVCAQAAATLAPHARTPSATHPRSLALALRRPGEADDFGSSPQATVLRSWAGVLLGAGEGWAAAADGLALRSAALLLPSSARGGAMSDSVARELWASDESAEGLVVLLPLGAAAARRGVEVLLPEGPLPALRVRGLAAGDALLLDARARWRFAGGGAPEDGAEDGDPGAAWAVFAYAPPALADVAAPRDPAHAAWVGLRALHALMIGEVP